MRSLTLLSAAMAFVLVLAVGGLVSAGGFCCSHCGCDSPCSKICRLVKEEKKVEIVCWGCKCEDFCLGKPSHVACEHCETVCDFADDPKSPCVKPKNFVWKEWVPGCGATMHTKKKLMKRVVTKKIPSFKWVVEDLCKDCENKAAVADIEPDAVVPLPPAVDAKMLYSRNAARGIGLE